MFNKNKKMLNKNKKNIKIHVKPKPALRFQGVFFLKNFKNYLS